MSLEDYMLPCLNKQFFGIDCLGCGIQRGFIHLVKGDFAAAFHVYPAIFTLVLFALFLLLNFKFKFKNSRKIPQYKSTSLFLVFLAPILILC